MPDRESENRADSFVPVQPGLALADGIVITGSRDITRTAGRREFALRLPGWLGQRRTWLVGGACGIDAWALEWLHERGEKCLAVVPFTVARQPRSVQAALQLAAERIELGLPDGKQAYIRRNFYMVEHAAVVAGFWSGKPGGTLATIRYAEQRGREVHCFPVAGGQP